MKIKLSKSQWEEMGKKAGWVKVGQLNQLPQWGAGKAGEPSATMPSKTTPQQKPAQTQPAQPAQQNPRIQRLKQNKQKLDDFIMKLSDLNGHLPSIGAIIVNLLGLGKETNNQNVLNLGKELQKIYDGMYSLQVSQDDFMALNQMLK
jgi:hypothetical protein